MKWSMLPMISYRKRFARAVFVPILLVLTLCLLHMSVNAQSCGFVSGKAGYCSFCNPYGQQTCEQECQEEWCVEPEFMHRISFCVAAGYLCDPNFSGCWWGGC
jgi:hypothetical protein